MCKPISKYTHDREGNYRKGKTRIVKRIWRRKNKEIHKEREEDKSKEEHRNT